MAPSSAQDIAEVLLQWLEDHPTLPPFAKHAVLENGMNFIDGRKDATTLEIKCQSLRAEVISQLRLLASACDVSVVTSDSSKRLSSSVTCNLHAGASRTTPPHQPAPAKRRRFLKWCGEPATLGMTVFALLECLS